MALYSLFLPILSFFFIDFVGSWIMNFQVWLNQQVPVFTDFPHSPYWLLKMRMIPHNNQDNNQLFKVSSKSKTVKFSPFFIFFGIPPLFFLSSTDGNEGGGGGVQLFSPSKICSDLLSLAVWNSIVAIAVNRRRRFKFMHHSRLVFSAAVPVGWVLFPPGTSLTTPTHPPP